MPIGDRKFVEHFFCQKFRNVEKSYYSLYGMGCRPDGLNYYTPADIYKKFCQSSFYYGLETNYISKATLNYLNIRQNILIKNSFGLNKFTSFAVGCCSHIACVIYYLSFGKYKDNLKKPAEF